MAADKAVATTCSLWTNNQITTMKLFICFLVYFTKPVFSAASENKRIIIDTDAGADDAVAIFNILGAEDLFAEVKVKLITTVNGNTNVDNVSRNVLKILKTAERLDIPVYKGARKALLLTPKTDDFFGSDGFGDFPFPDPPPESLIRKEHAVNALIESVSLNPGKLTLLCLGPLTNIALAIRLYPQFLQNLKDIFVLGGSDTGLGNIKPGVEFNVFIDPESTFIVFQSAKEVNKTINLITWETAYKRSYIDMEWRKNVLGLVKSPQMEILNQAEKNLFNKDIWLSSDTYASSVLLDDSIVESSKKYYVDVEVCGSFSKGVLLIDYENFKNITPNVKIIERINTEKFKKMLLQNLNPKGGLSNSASKL